VVIAFDEYGPKDGLATVLLHGAGTSGWMWRKQVEELAPDFHVLVPDLPGHGRSNRHPWISIPDTAARIADLISAHTIARRAHVVGLSLGGYVALQLAAAAPEVLSGATVSGVNVLPFPHAGGMRLLGWLMAPFLTVGPMLRANARSLNVPAEEFDGYRTAAKAMTRRTFIKVNDEAVKFRIPTGAEHSACSVLAVAGENEHDLVRRSLVQIALAFPEGQGRLVPGVGHAWNGQKPELFSAMVRSRVTGGPLPPELKDP
jgi:pimeloyl-ACP methyl ester carboxylesterase